jgi:hypothetical protein
MIEKAAVLVECNDEQRLVPVWPGSQRVIDLVERLFAGCRASRPIGMVRRGRLVRGDPNRFEKAERRQTSFAGIFLELFDTGNVPCALVVVDRRDLTLKKQVVGQVRTNLLHSTEL